jgi:23S rRNA (uracil1939-C5)-methyltransferase
VSAPVELRIDAIAAGGDGVGRHAGLVVFVPRTAPGDLARVRLASRGRFARGELLDLVERSAERVEPPCPHYVDDRCGGCQLQHLRYDAQLAAKARLVRDALQRIGGRLAEAPAVVPSAAEWRYRRKLTLALRRADGRWVAGLHAYDDPRHVFDLADCPITDERVLLVWAELRAAGEQLPRARELRVSVRLLDAGDAAVVVEGGDAWPTRAAFFAAVPSVRELWWQRGGEGLRRRVGARGPAGDPPAAGASFVQVNAAAAASLGTHLLARAMAHAPASAVDAYAGTGDTAAALAERGVRVTALEVDTAACAVSAARLPEGSRAVAGRVEETLAGALPADLVIVNPPRGGLHERVPAVLEGEHAGHRALLYVSCNPATLARDLARLPSHQLVSLRSFDMFPQTAHVETVCELVRRGP